MEVEDASSMMFSTKMYLVDVHIFWTMLSNKIDSRNLRVACKCLQNGCVAESSQM